MLHGGQESPRPGLGLELRPATGRWRGGAVRGRVVALDAGDRVELALVPVRAAERLDRPGVVQERVRVAEARLKLNTYAISGWPSPSLSM